MKVENFKPNEGFLITKKEVAKADVETLEFEENTDDFLVYGEVLKSSSLSYAPTDLVIYHVLNAQEFRDGSQTYNLVHEDNILGTYVADATTNSK